MEKVVSPSDDSEISGLVTFCNGGIQLGSDIESVILSIAAMSSKDETLQEAIASLCFNDEKITDEFLDQLALEVGTENLPDMLLEYRYDRESGL
jgi:hypothetical protein